LAAKNRYSLPVDEGVQRYNVTQMHATRKPILPDRAPVKTPNSYQLYWLHRYELCHQLPVVNGETVGIEFAHKNARLAAEFMREIIKPEYSIN